jgi:uncharacterized protein YozE (UPF0346 family)
MTAPTADQLARLLDAHPKLSRHGYDHEAAREPQALAASRAQLLGSLDEVQAAHAWLVTLYPIGDGKLWPTSYRLKHDAEDAEIHHYISNGAMIAAALLADAPIQITPGRPNPAIGLTTAEPRPVPTASSFTAWLEARVGDGSPVGDLADDVRDDESWPVNATTYRELVAYLDRHRAANGAYEALRQAWGAYSGQPVPDDEDEDDLSPA